MKWLAAIGDSKTYGSTCCVATNGYRDLLTADLTALGSNEFRFLPPYAVPGVTTATAAGAIDSYLASFVEVEKVPEAVLINLGSNDLIQIHLGNTDQAAWVGNMGTILDAVHAKWPTALVYLMRVYNSDWPTEQTALDDTYIPDVLSTRGAWAFVGPDERTFLPGNTSDNTHPTAHGYDLTNEEWQAAMGY